jgi:hypothetical protein
VVESSGTGWCAAEEGALPVDRQRQAREVVVAVAACGDGVSFDGEAPRGCRRGGTQGRGTDRGWAEVADLELDDWLCASVFFLSVLL